MTANQISERSLRAVVTAETFGLEGGEPTTIAFDDAEHAAARSKEVTACHFDLLLAPMRRRLLCSVSHMAMRLGPAPQARKPGNDGGMWRAIVAAGPSIWGRVERAPIWAFRLRHWLVRLAALAFCAGAFWLIAFLVFGRAAALWVAAFAATGLFPAVLGLRWRDRQAEARHGDDHAPHP